MSTPIDEESLIGAAGTIAGALADVAHAIENVASSLSEVARSLDRLGTNNASSPMGAIELLAKEVKDGTANIDGALTAVSRSIEELAGLAESDDPAP